MKFMVKMIAFFTDSEYTEPDGIWRSRGFKNIQMINETPLL